ncbi:flagellin FliC [bacterium]|nr:flagellin FliC [bacterium]
MTISLGNNLSALRSITSLTKSTRELSNSFEKLSSGLRINKASDDPAGLAMAEGLRADAMLAAVAVRNANDGISVVSIADAAMGEISSILGRMAELAEQSANGTYTTTQRSALASEFVALGSEIERIASTTAFNDMTLLSDSSSISIQVGFDNTGASVVQIDGVLATLDALGVGTPGGALSYSINGASDAFAQTAAAAALDAINTAISTLATNRGQIGAAEGRLSAAISYLEVARENYVAADSRIRDADIASEVAELVRQQVLQQSAAAILAQANQQPAVALSLLQ